MTWISNGDTGSSVRTKLNTIPNDGTICTVFVAVGKTFTVANTVTVSATDGAAVNLGTGGNVPYTSNDLSVFATGGAIAPATVNGLTITTTTGTLTLANAKTLTVSNSITLAGTDSTTMTFPTTSATIARTDAANTFTGHQTIEGVTTTGATGTGNLVFSAAPALSGNVTFTSNNSIIQAIGTNATIQAPFIGVTRNVASGVLLAYFGANGTADGDMVLNFVTSAGPRLLMGGATSAFPAISRSGVSLQLVLADGSAGCDVVQGTAALATNAASGFLWIESCAGTPTGTPTTYAGRVPLIFDTTNSQFWIYTAGAWKQPKTPAAAALVTWQ